MSGIARHEANLGQFENHDDQMALSRRSFVSAVGALVALPAVTGGVLMPVWTDEAYAAEGDPKTTKIMVVKRTEFGICVGDVAENKKSPVKGAAVKLISLANNKSVSGVTDGEGKVALDITSLDTPKKDEFGVEMYSFFAQLEISAEGYRNYRTGRIYVVGGRGTMAPTRKHDNENVYPQQVTFDDWDALYTTNSFAVTSGNDVKHTFKIELVTKVNEAMQVSIVSEGRSEPIAKQQVTPANGVAKLEFTDYYLMSNHKSALPIGKKLFLQVEYSGTKHSADLSMQTQASPDKATAPGTSKVTLSPFNPNKLKPQITMPNWVPVLGGQVIDVWMPTLPVNFWFDPYGFVFFVARTGELGYKYKDSNGKVEVDAWKYHPRKTSEDQWSEAESDRKALTQKVGKAIRGKWGLLSQVGYTDTIKATAMLQIAAAGKWRNDEALWRMGVSMQAVLAFNVSFSKQLMVGPIPAILEFSFMSSLTLGVSAGIATTELGDIDKYTWDYGNDGISVTIVLAPCLSFGVGIKGLLSASIEGQLSFSFCVAVRAVPHDAASNVKNPHIVMGLVAQVNVVLQAFIFSKTFNLWNAGDPNLYDNWNGKPLTAQSLSAQAADELADFADGMEIVTDASLAEVEEFSSAGFPEQTMSAQSEAAPEFVVEELEMRTDDGVAYTCVAYTPSWLVEHAPKSAKTTAAGEGGEGVNLVAASSSELTAQGMTAQATLPDEAKYNKSGSAEYQGFVEERSSKRFKGIASLSGLVPANDVCVAKGVFSDPRIKAITIGDKTHIFRISTVKVGNDSRTRVVGQVLNSKSGGVVGDMTVYDFNPTIPPDSFWDVFNPAKKEVNRNELYDYDFDVVYTPQSSGTFGIPDLVSLLSGKTVAGMLTFFIVSGKRKDANSTSYADAACNQLFSVVRYLVFTDGTSRLVGSFGSTTSDKSFDAAGGGNARQYHSFSCPQLHPLGTNGNDGIAGWMLTYLDRAGASPEDAVSADAGKASVGLGVCFIDSTGKILAVKTKDLVDHAKSITDSSIYEKACVANFASGADNTTWHLVMMRGRNEVFYYLLRTATLPSAFGPTTALNNVKAVTVPKSTDSEPMRLVEWPGHRGQFLTSHGGKLQKATISDLSGTPSVKFEDCGPTNFNVNAFGVDPSGNVIFWPACGEDNAGYEYDKDGKGTKRKAEEVHQIMGARLRNGTFSDPFVYGEVKHDMHMLQVIDYLNKDSLTIVSVDMKEAKKGHADLWFTSIPLVKCANVIGCEAVSPFNYPGERALFYLTVRNDGNTYLSGFTAKLAEHGKSAVSSAKLSFSQATLCESGYNPAGGDGKLQNIEPDYALAPGKTSVYQVEIEIPKDWKSEKKVTVSASDAVVAGGGSLKAQGAITAQAEDDEATGDVEEYIVGTGDFGTKDYDDELEDGTGQAPFDILDIWYEDTYDDDSEEDYEDAPFIPPDGKDGGSSGGNAAGTKPSPRGTSAKTGDVAGPLGLAAIALAAAGAGLAAYSKRRSDLEDTQE